jgi:hypothetical protein
MHRSGFESLVNVIRMVAASHLFVNDRLQLLVGHLGNGVLDLDLLRQPGNHAHIADRVANTGGIIGIRTSHPQAEIARSASRPTAPNDQSADRASRP